MFELTPEVLAISVNNGVMTCMGRGFPPEKNRIRVKVAGREQVMERVLNKNQFTCKMTDIESTDDDMEVEVYTDEGRARTTPEARKVKAPRPRLRGISNGKASKKGCKLRIQGESFARDAKYELINETGRPICDDMKYVSSSEIECASKPGDYNPKKCRLRRKNRTPFESDIPCEGENCSFETSDEETPVVSQCSRKSRQGRKETYTIKGRRFKSSKGGCKVRIGAVEASKVTVVSETEIEVEFEGGCGFPQGVKPEVEFDNGDVSEVEGGAAVTVPVENVTPPPKKVCSVRGGDVYEYSGPGLGTDKSMEVQICGFNCPRDATKETDDKIVCEMPPIHSALTVEKHSESEKIQNLYNLPSTSIYSSNTELARKVFDGSTFSRYGTTELCYVGIKISTYQRMNIKSIRYYMNKDVIKEQYIGGVFKASLDGVSWTKIHEIKELPCDGWNTVDDNCKPLPFNKYRYVKYQPSPTFLKACDFAELQFIG